MLFLTFIPRPLQTGSKWPQWIHSLYWSLSKPLFVIAVFMTTLPSMLGLRHSFFDLLLNTKLFMFISRISFCTYLAHLMVVYQCIYTQNHDYYYYIQDVFVRYFGVLVICLFFGFLLTLFVEVPFSNLLKLMTKPQKKGSNEKKLAVSHQK